MAACTAPAKYRPTRITLLALLSMAAALRMAVLLQPQSQLLRDPDGYRQLAETLQQDGTLGSRPAGPDPAGSARPSAFRPPVYPLLLAACFRTGMPPALCIGILHLLCGTLTVGFVWRLAGDWGLDARGQCIAAALIAIDPILLAQTPQVMTETVATLLSVVALSRITRAGRLPSVANCALAGGTAALAALCRPTFCVWLGAVGVALVGIASQRGLGRTAASAYFAAAALTFAPWIVRNTWAFGRPIAATTHGGYTLLLGNNPDYYRHLRERPWDEAWRATALQEKLRAAIQDSGAVGEVECDQVAYGLARDSIVRDPGAFACAAARRLTRLWGILPQQVDAAETSPRRAARLAVAAFYAIELALAAWGLWRVGRNLLRAPWLWGTLLAASFTAIHALYWADLRMRAPLMPAIAVAAACGAAGATCKRNTETITE